MTPRQARVALGGFVLVAAGVTCNALYLQSAIHRTGSLPKVRPVPPAPAPAGGTAETGKAEERRAAPRPLSIAGLLETHVAGSGTDLAVPPEEADAEAVRSIQRELERRGYGPLAADGIMRPAARAAVMAFEEDHGLPLTGEATQALLERLVFGAPDATGAVTAAPEVKSPHAEALIKDVQRRLTARGYRPGLADGRLRPATVSAIRVFETDEGLVPRGRISAEVVSRLRRPVAEAKGRDGR